MQTFETTAPITSTLDIPAGSLRFIAADRTDTTVEILPTDASKRRDVEAAEQTRVDYRDGVLRVEGPETKRILGGAGSVEVTVQLPSGSRVGAKAASAELRGVGRLGDVTVESSHGPIKLDEAASVSLSVAAGDVSVGRLTGPAKITVQKGDIAITEATQGTVTLQTQAGDVEIGAARGVSASLDAGTSYGRIRNSLGNADGAADLEIHATTSAGDITGRSL